MKARLVFVIALLLLAPAGAGVAPTAASAAPDVLSEGLRKALVEAEPGDALDLIVRFHAWPSAEEARELAEAGFVLQEAFRTLPAFRAASTPAGVAYAAGTGDVAYLELNAPIHLHLDDATRQTRARDVWDPETEMGEQGIVVNGQVVDGSGVGVAVVDSGIDATHPDLQWHAKVKKNYWRVVPSANTFNWFIDNAEFPHAQFVDVPNSDAASGHGTHVASTVAGTGAASDGLHKGAAPGATLYGFGMGAGLHLIAALEAFDYILANLDTFDPAIRVVTNSWGSCSERHDPSSLNAVLTNRLVEEGIVVLYAMGNIDLACPTPEAGPAAQNPTPGVIGVANYDGTSGGRDGSIASSSSEGYPDAPEGWPDVAAPGTRITAAMSTSGGGYTTKTGTSMATPHVAGIVALLLQADPTLTPAEIEHVLQATAHPFDDDIDPVQGHHKKGFGLVDAFKALHALGFGGANDGVQALAVQQDGGEQTPLDRTAKLAAEPGNLSVSGDVRFLEDLGNGTDAVGYKGTARIYDLGMIDYSVLVNFFVSGVPRTVFAGEYVDLSLRSVEPVGGAPDPDNLTTEFEVIRLDTGERVHNGTEQIRCSSSCSVFSPWLIPFNATHGAYRLYGNITHEGVVYPTDSLDFQIVGRNGFSAGSTGPAAEDSGQTGSTATPTVEVRYGGGAWATATLEDDGVHWSVNVTVPDVIEGDALLEVRATLGDQVRTDVVVFKPVIAVDVLGPDFVLVNETLTLEAIATPEGDYSYAWDLDYDGVTFDEDATGENLTTSFATTGTHTVAVRVLNADGQGTIRPVDVRVAKATVLLDVTEDQLPWVPEALVWTELDYAGFGATPYEVNLTGDVVALEVTLDWEHYSGRIDPVFGFTANDFDLWFTDPDGHFDHHGAATGNHGEYAYLQAPAGGVWTIDVTPFLVVEPDTYHLVVVAYTA